MQNALESINNGMSYGIASDTFGIPKSTLHKRIRIGPNLKKVGKKTALSTEEEKQLVNYLLFMANAGTPFTPGAAIDTAARIAGHRYL